MHFQLRDYKPEDFFSLWAIDQSCFAAGIAYTQFELKTFIRRATSFTLVAEASEPGRPPVPNEKSGRISLRNSAPLDAAPIFGFLVAERGPEGHIITIDVRSEARKLGVGSALIDAAEKQLRSKGCRQVRLETAVDNSAALAFYKKHGYSVTKVVPRYYSNGVDALVLEKDLLSFPASANVQR